MECEEISQILLRFLEKFQVRNSRALVQEVGVEEVFQREYFVRKAGRGTGEEHGGAEALRGGAGDVREGMRSER